MQAFDWQTLPYSIVVGVDEVGRGALAGPVYAGAVVLKTENLNSAYQLVDSKSLSAAQRQKIAQYVRTQHMAFVARASVGEIEKHNILGASLLAMRRAVEGVLKKYERELGQGQACDAQTGWSCDAPLYGALVPLKKAKAVPEKMPAPHPTFQKNKVMVLVDGNQKIKALPYAQQTLVKGDQRAAPIAAASIVAKVARDELLCRLDKKYPGYGLAQHKGYGTRVHRAALQKLGPTLAHRMSYAPVKNAVRV